MTFEQFLSNLSAPEIHSLYRHHSCIASFDKDALACRDCLIRETCKTVTQEKPDPMKEMLILIQDAIDTKVSRPEPQAPESGWTGRVKMIKTSAKVTCSHCKKTIPKGESVVFVSGGYYHPECHKKKTSAP